MAQRRVTGVDEVAYSTDLLLSMLVRSPGMRAGVNFDRWEAVTDSNECNGLVVLCKDQVVVRSEVGAAIIEDVRIVSEHPNLVFNRRTPIIQCNQLFVKMIEGGPGGRQPVLEHADVTNIHVALQHVPHRIDREFEVLVVFFERQITRRTQV